MYCVIRSFIITLLPKNFSFVTPFILLTLAQQIRNSGWQNITKSIGMRGDQRCPKRDAKSKYGIGLNKSALTPCRMPETTIYLTHRFQLNKCFTCAKWLLVSFTCVNEECQKLFASQKRHTMPTKNSIVFYTIYIPIVEGNAKWTHTFVRGQLKNALGRTIKHKTQRRIYSFLLLQ